LSRSGENCRPDDEGDNSGPDNDSSFVHAPYRIVLKG
jgi:hypothetical protein